MELPEGRCFSELGFLHAYCIFFKTKFGEFADSKYILVAKFSLSLKGVLPLLLLLSSTTAVIGQIPGTVGSSSLYSAGYQNLICTDSGRNYKPGAKKTDRFYNRPIEIDLWYPAKEPTVAEPVRYGDFLQLLEQRSNRFQDDTLYKTMTDDLIQYLCVNLSIQDSSKLTGLKTRSYLGAQPAGRNFPIIIYMTSLNGMSFENINLFEFLAEHGYIVASIASVGRYPGNMQENLADLLEQINDGSFALQYLKKVYPVDSSAVGVIGYSWGGLAASGLAILQPGIKCILSFDGSEMHYYGDSKKEDQDFNQIRFSPWMNPQKIRVPYAYLESGAKQQDREVDSIYNWLPFLWTSRSYARFPGAVHEDFSCLPYLLPDKKSGGLNLYRQFCNFSLHFFDQYLKNQPPSFPGQLSFLFQRHLADSLYPQINHDTQPVFIVEGRIRDAVSRQPLAYVNVGIPFENTGTVSGHDGSFRIQIKKSFLRDSLKFSMVGYTPQSWRIRDIQKQIPAFVIYMKPQTTELQEVVVTRKLLKEKILGNTTTTKFVSVGLPLKFLGSEIGVKINLGKKAVVLKNFNFNISDIRLDTAVFRLNIYQFRNGKPQGNILQKNILIPVGRRSGQYTVNLSAYKLVLKDDILISIEWIEGSTTAKENGALFLSASFLSAATWHRLTSQADWKKASGLGVGFNLEVQQIPSN
jgi:pimeloyl-ACP methyl ester carboxylesterase